MLNIFVETENNKCEKMKHLLFYNVLWQIAISFLGFIHTVHVYRPGLRTASSRVEFFHDFSNRPTFL